MQPQYRGRNSSNDNIIVNSSHELDVEISSESPISVSSTASTTCDGRDPITPVFATTLTEQRSLKCKPCSTKARLVSAAGAASSPDSTATATTTPHDRPPMESLKGTVVLVSLFIFVVVAGSGIAMFRVFSTSSVDKFRHDIIDRVNETGAWFANEIDKSVLPLHSLGQFALELDSFAQLHNQIGPALTLDSRPFLPSTNNNNNQTTTPLFRNVSGLCDTETLTTRFAHIATSAVENSNVGGALVNFQLAPYGVVCLVHTTNVTDSTTGQTQILDSKNVVGLDLLNDPRQQTRARESLKSEAIDLVGPITLVQCPTCGRHLIARLPIRTNQHNITFKENDSPISYPRWGFATALLNWDIMVERSGLQDKFLAHQIHFKISRIDPHSSNNSNSNEVIMWQSDEYGTSDVALNSYRATFNEWVYTAEYEDPESYSNLIVALIVIIAFWTSFLVGMVMVQKQNHTKMIGLAVTQHAKVEMERNMTAYFAHELRNPLSAIDSALQSLPYEDISEQSRELIVGMQLCSSFMSSIMNNLLDVRKMEEGKLILRADPFSLQQLVHDARKMALPTVALGVELLVMSSTEDRDWVVGDEPRLQQIMTNLVSNAIKYTKHGSVTISASWTSNGEVCLECRDTGPGIPKEDQALMFERFTQRGGAPGSGLGLAIAKQMVTLMGGTIKFISDPTVRPGTICRVQLPLLMCEEPPESLFVKDELEPMNEALRILIVDDVKMNRSMLVRRLQKGIAPNCDVTEAMNGEQALAICEQQSFDVIIVDQYMEEAGGVMVGTDVIIAMRRNGVRSLVIGCSGNDLDEKFFSAGADLIWKKPMPSNVEIIRQFRHKFSRRPSTTLPFDDDYV